MICAEKQRFQFNKTLYHKKTTKAIKIRYHPQFVISTDVTQQRLMLRNDVDFVQMCLVAVEGILEPSVG